MPASSSAPLGSRLMRSNHAGIWKPELSVTGIVGAVGQMIFMFVGRISARVDAQPCPVSPRPWRKIRVAVCLPEAEITTGAADMLFGGVVEEEEEEVEEEEEEKALENFSPIEQEESCM